MRCMSCEATFDIGEAAVVYKQYGNVSYPEKRCPLCGGAFRAIDLPKCLEKYLHINDDERYYYITVKG